MKWYYAHYSKINLLILIYLISFWRTVSITIYQICNINLKIVARPQWTIYLWLHHNMVDNGHFQTSQKCPLRFKLFCDNIINVTFFYQLLLLSRDFSKSVKWLHGLRLVIVRVVIVVTIGKRTEMYWLFHVSI